ncbi:MAG TPA: hypothetical protein VII95_00830 [Terriglobales bacterium]|jgi:hypothetical protein
MPKLLHGIEGMVDSDSTILFPGYSAIPRNPTRISLRNLTERIEIKINTLEG